MDTEPPRSSVYPWTLFANFAKQYSKLLHQVERTAASRALTCALQSGPRPIAALQSLRQSPIHPTLLGFHQQPIDKSPLRSVLSGPSRADSIRRGGSMRRLRTLLVFLLTLSFATAGFAQTYQGRI